MSHIQTFEIMNSSEIHPVPLCFPAKPPSSGLVKNNTNTHTPDSWKMVQLLHWTNKLYRKGTNILALPLGRIHSLSL